MHTKLRPVLDLMMAARPGARDYMRMRLAVRTKQSSVMGCVHGADFHAHARLCALHTAVYIQAPPDQHQGKAANTHALAVYRKSKHL